MSDDKYQIKQKAHYINLLILIDELSHYYKELSLPVPDISNLISKLRVTRAVFLTLNNVLDFASITQINVSDDFVIKTRILKKNLRFAKHFRNIGIGHLDINLLKKAAQWSPQIFYELSKNDNCIKTVEAQRAIIESCINSFIDDKGIQKIFGTEIDLMYPPDTNLFLTYLLELINETLIWLNEASASLLEKINHYNYEDIPELASIAGSTNFNLKDNTQPTYSPENLRAGILKVTQELEKQGIDIDLNVLLSQKITTKREKE